MDEKYIVYVHTNKTNGMKYVGITCRPTWRRWGHGSGYHTNPRFYRAIKKYTWEGFEHDVVAEGLTKEQAEAEEVRLIKLYDSTNRTKGYNLDNGGSGSNRVTDDTKRRISEAGKKRFSRPEEHQKLSEAAKRRNQDAEKFASLCEGNRRRWMREGEREKITRGLKSYYEENPNRKQKISEERRKFFAEHPEKKTTKVVLQMNFEGEIIARWNSLTEAAQVLGIDVRGISAACHNKIKTSGGFRWSFAE